MAYNEKSRANLVPAWSPGESGNPNGKPKGAKSLTTLLREAASKNRLCTQSLPDGQTAAEALTEAMFYHAIKGNVGYAKEIFERLDGKVAPPQLTPPDDDGVAPDDDGLNLDDSRPRRKGERSADSGDQEPEITP